MESTVSHVRCWLIAAAIIATPCSIAWSAPYTGLSPDTGELLDRAQGNASQDTMPDSLWARVSALENEMKAAKFNLAQLQGKLAKLEQKNTAHEKLVAGLDSSVSVVQSDASHLQMEAAGIKTKLDQTSDALDGRIDTVDARSGRHWLLTLLFGLLLVGLLGLAYWGLRRLVGRRARVVDAELDRINTDVQAKLMKVDSELVSSLEKLLHAKPTAATTKADAEIDHSLALKVADEVTRIEQNLAQMDASVRGHKQLSAAVKRLHENLQAAGYELPQLLGKPFDEGMKVTAAFVPDDSLQKDERKITRVFKPTVLFQGSMIQAGDIQVSQH